MINKSFFFKNKSAKNFRVKKVFLVVFLITSICLRSQYDSAFEEEIFLSLNDGLKPDPYALFNAIKYEEELFERGLKEIDQIVKVIRSGNFSSKSRKRKIQLIYKKVHDKFLKHYKENAKFSDIFETGNYNCVGATALFALVFDEFDINYAIKEKPTHVYLVADTLGLQTTIETTLPNSGVLTYNSKFKNDFINYLKKNKLITKAEYNNTTTDYLFQKYFNSDKSINLTKLGAIQYYNNGLLALNSEEFKRATDQFKKAILLNPSNSNKYLYNISLSNALIDDINNNIYDGKSFGNNLKFNNGDEEIKNILISYFQNTAYKLCINKPDQEQFKHFFEEILEVCTIESLPNEIPHLYHFYNANHYRINGKYKESMIEVAKAHQYKKEDLGTKDLAQTVLMQNTISGNNNEKSIDILEDYFDQMPFLSEYTPLQNQYVNNYMKVIYDNFKFQKPVEGEIYYNRFLKGIVKYNINEFNDDMINNGLGYMSYYWVLEDKGLKALDIINNAISLVPESYKISELKQKIKTIVNQKKRIQKIRYPEITDNYQPNPYKDLNQRVNDYFPNKWKAVSILIGDTEQSLNEEEIFKFIAYKDKKCTYIINGKEEKGKWAFRPKSKTLYFIPNNDKDNYKVFKLKSIDETELVILPYKDQKKPSPYRYFLVAY